MFFIWGVCPGVCVDGDYMYCISHVLHHPMEDKNQTGESSSITTKIVIRITLKQQSIMKVNTNTLLSMMVWSTFVAFYEKHAPNHFKQCCVSKMRCINSSILFWSWLEIVVVIHPQWWQHWQCQWHQGWNRTGVMGLGRGVCCFYGTQGHGRSQESFILWCSCSGGLVMVVVMTITCTSCIPLTAHIPLFLDIIWQWRVFWCCDCPLQVW